MISKSTRLNATGRLEGRPEARLRVSECGYQIEEGYPAVTGVEEEGSSRTTGTTYV